MLERKQILPIGSTIAVCYRTDGGKETILQVVGHLTMRRAKAHEIIDKNETGAKK